MFTIILIFLLLSTSALAADSPSLVFSRLGVEDGLPHNTVNGIMQDKTGYIWFATRDGIARYDGTSFRNYRDGLENSHIISLVEDNDGKIWVGTIDGVFIFDPVTEKFQKFENIAGKINRIVIDGNNNIWIAVFGYGLFLYSPDDGTLNLYQADGKPGSISTNYILDIYIDGNNTLWAGVIGATGSGVNRFDAVKKTFTLYPLSDVLPNVGVSKITGNDSDSLFIGTLREGVFVLNTVTKRITPFINDTSRNMFVNDLAISSDNTLWAATGSGIYIKNLITGAVRHVIQDFSDYRSLTDITVSCLSKDRENGMWIGTMSGGVNYLPGNYHAFEKYYPVGTSDGLTGGVIRDICEESPGIMWIASERNGLNRFDMSTMKITRYSSSNNKIYSDNITSLMMHNNELWIGYIGEGLEIMNTTTGIRRQLIKNISHPFDNTVMALCPDFNNDVYIGTTLHLIKYSAHNDTMTIIKEIPHGTFISDILQDSRHNLWVALYGKGVYRLNTKTNRWDHFTHPTSLCYDYCISLSTDSDGRIWIGTEGGGVSCYNYQTDSFRSWSIADGLPANTVYKVIDDNRSSLWLSTTKGLCRMTKDGRITTFTRSNGLLNDQFNYKSGILASDGRLYFGSREGFIRFKVQDISSNQLIPTVVITQLRALDRDIPVFNNLPLNLKHNQSTITINYAALSYNAPELNRYAVKMENYDTDWIEMGNNHSVTYSNMPPGDYQFKVKGSNNDGLWNDIPTVLPITIASPWWSSAFMKYCYLLLICYCIYFIYRYIRKRNAFKWQQKLDDLNRAKEKAIYDAKLKFFATVSHEIRTPLSLIKAPFEYICRKNVASEAFFPDNLREDFQENMDIMGLNIDRLISLCNQLLDFSKVENENFILCYTQTNISDTIISILQWFKPVIKQKNITLNTSFPDTPPMSYIDGEALTKIISNLMNNATRYAKSEISLSLHLTDDSFIIKIANDGIPILPANREKVFDIFFREQRKDGQGAGLGLAIVKHLTELLHGKVFLDPDTAQTCFVVDIPLTTVPPSSADTETTPPYSDNFQCPNFINERPVILVVEDNPDMRQFLCKLLNDAYNVLAADDGDSAMEKLNSCEIHLIVSDVKMQRIDGFTLCRQLKTCLKYSHIPIILLTAKTAISDKIEGIEAGADAYIEKPFSSDLLLARIQSILNNRQRLKDAFLSSPYSFIDAIATGEADRKFIETINNIILNNITDSDFSIDNLASEVCMSRSTLDRKIKGLAHITTNDYIKLVRIKQAAKLISEKNYKINEVCYMTGFSSPSYFTKCFKEQFGITPNDLMRKK